MTLIRTNHKVSSREIAQMTLKQSINNRFIETVEHLVKTKRVKNKSKLTQELSINPNSLSEIKSGRSNAQIDSIIRLCDLYDVSLLYILKGETTIEDSMNYLTISEASTIIDCSVDIFKKYYSEKLTKFSTKNNPKEQLFNKEDVLSLKKELQNDNKKPII
ncbi:helix-turn-helix domain-containing protein [Flavobacterium sp. JP2137]|uniref:helix-turn-helix domain-containing protein n=1 Tax=Flavobacterium sp. JP2137 TaxID=3414510 RepID=UPI003D2FB76F